MTWLFTFVLWNKEVHFFPRVHYSGKIKIVKVSEILRVHTCVCIICTEIFDKKKTPLGRYTYKYTVFTHIIYVFICIRCSRMSRVLTRIARNYRVRMRGKRQHLTIKNVTKFSAPRPTTYYYVILIRLCTRTSCALSWFIDYNSEATADVK